MRWLILCLMVAIPAVAKTVSKPVAYEVDSTKLEGVLIYDDASKTPRPGLVLVPNWMGVTPANLKQAEMIASDKYVVFVADMFGKANRPKNMDEAGKISGAVKSDRPLMRKRVEAALKQLQSAKEAPLDSAKLGALGFCFGGTTALELARGGAKIGAAVSFHGGLATPNPDDAKNIKAKILALHGADDPFVPVDEVKGFEEEMRKAKVDWQLVAYGNAVHGFTDTEANMAGKVFYNPVVSARAYAAMESFFKEAWAAKP